jgi:hypothetical protein
MYSREQYDTIITRGPVVEPGVAGPEEGTSVVDQTAS